VHEFVPNSILSPRSVCFVIFALGALLFSHFNKLGEIVQNSEFSPRSAYFVIFALGKAFFSQSERVGAKQLFEREIRTFSHFRHWAHHFLVVLSKVHEFVQKRRFQSEITNSCHFRTGRTSFY